MRLLDRYIIKSFLFNYVLAFSVLVGLYVLLDLIVNVSNFTKAAPAGAGGNGWMLLSLAGDICDYYSYQLLVIFQLLSGVIPLLAAGFTMVRMTRHHELTAMLASGVSLYRVATPIVLCALVFSALVVVDEEVLMPRCSEKLLRRHEDVSKQQAATERLYFVRDEQDNSLLVSSEYDPGTHTMKEVGIFQRDPQGRLTGRILAPEAVWKKNPDNALLPGTWSMKNARQIDDSGDPTRRVAEQVRDIERTTRLTPDQLDLLASKKAVEFLSSAQIQALILNSPELTRPGLEKIMHTRFTQLIMNMVMLLLGIPFLLTREPRRLIKNMIYCTAVSAVCFVSTFVMFQMAGSVVAPLLGAWLPVLIFGPMALAMLDAIKT